MDFSNVWNWVVPIGGGITVGAILITIGVFLVKTIASKLLNKVLGKENVETIVSNVVSQSSEKIKEITFVQEIQPLAQSELMKVREEAEKMWSQKYFALTKQYADTVNVIEKFADYFENSIGVSEEKKQALKGAIAEMRENAPITPEKVVLEVKVKDEENKSVVAEETAETPIVVER